MPRSSRIFRLFVSSTFTDLKHERTALQRHVFPRLKALCEQYGTKFQALDLRWGISTEAQLDHRTLDICLNELRRCKELSPKPNFLILLGNRYGWRPVPNTIEKSEFELILQYAKETSQEAYTFLQDWYKEDLNQIPISYRLLPRTGIYEVHENWDIIERMLRVIFDKALDNLPFTEEQKNKYILSATEHEIREGAFKQDDAGDHVFAFFRELKNIPHVSKKKSEFLDTDPNGVIDHVSEERLSILKQDIEGLLPDENIIRHSVDWNEDDIDPSYLPQFCQEILTKLEAVIRRECEEIQEVTLVEKEREIHQLFSKSHSQHFIGRDIEFNKVSKKLKSESDFLVISGDSGVGKTAFIAELSNRLQKDIPASSVIQRYIGASSFGMNTFELLQSIIIELDPKREEDILEKSEFGELSEELSKSLKAVQGDSPLFILIDAIDQLQDSRILSTLFTQSIPENLTIIATVAHDSPMFNALQGILSEDKFITIEKMYIDQGEQLLDQWLKANCRVLQPVQKKAVLEAFKQCPLPLYLKLAIEEIKMWTSYDEQFTLSNSIEGILKRFFVRLSHPSNHGPILIKNVFGLLAASRNGLEEGELLDILSENAEVMEDFYSKSKHEYIGKSLPIVIWARLYNDLEPFLIERNDNGSYLYNFYHKQIDKNIKKTYLELSFHKEIINYFDGQSNFVDGELMGIPNIRKVVELPFQLYKAGENSGLENLLADFHFLRSKLQAKLSHDLLRDYDNLQYLQKELKESSSYADDFARFCRSYHALLMQYPQQIMGIALRLHESSAVFQEAKRWFSERDMPYLVGRQGSHHNHQNTYSFNLRDDKFTDCLWHPNGTQLLTIHEEIIKVWNIHTGEEEKQITPDIGTICGAVFSNKKDLLAIWSEHKYKIIQFQTYLTVIEEETKEKLTTIVFNQDAEIIVTGSKKGYIEIYHLPVNKKIVFRPLEEEILQIAWRDDSQELAIWYNSGFDFISNSVIIWDIQNQLIKKELKSAYQPFKMSSTEHYGMKYDSSGQFLCMSEAGSIVVWDIEEGIKSDGTVNLESGRHFFYGSFIISLLDNKEIHIWEKDSGASIVKIQQPSTERFKAANFCDGLLAVITVEGKVTIWDFRKVNSNDTNDQYIKWAYDHPLWVFAHYIDGFKKLLSKFTLKDLLTEVFTGKNKDGFESVLLSSSLSSTKRYMASAHKGKYLQIHDRSIDEKIQFMPSKSGLIHLCHWSFDEKLIAFGTKECIWIMSIPSGNVKRMIKTSSDILSAAWSPLKNILAYYQLNGQIELVDISAKRVESWSLVDVAKPSPRTIVKWSPNGEYLSICAEEEFIIYKINMTFDQIEEKLVMKGKLNEIAVGIDWSLDNKKIAFVSKDCQIIVVDIERQKSINHRQCFIGEPSDSFFSILGNVTKQPYEKIVTLEEMAVGLDVGGLAHSFNHFIHYLGSSCIISWHHNGNLLSIAIGNWLKVFILNEMRESDFLYTDEPVREMYWNEDILCTIEGDKFIVKEYVISI